MLHLLQPIWLLASAGILIPVAIHLWNVRQGKTLKIGSVELLARTAQQHARSLRLTELFLLVLRCLLIMLLSLLLAKPYWEDTSKQKGWIVIGKKNTQQAYAKFQPLIDSLLKAGYTFHLFEKGFAESDLTKIISEQKDTITTETTSYWQLVKMLDEQLLRDIPVYLFTDNELNHFTGGRPVISRVLTWKIFTPVDSGQVFIANAYETTGDSIAVKTGSSNSQGTVYFLQMLAKNKPLQNGFRLNVSEGKLQVAYQNGLPVVVDTATLRITVFADGYEDDARYLQAAIQSVQEVSGRKIILKTISKLQEIPARQDWLFWFSGQPVLKKINADHVFVYADGKTIPLVSWIQEKNVTAQDKIKLYQRIFYNAKNRIALWRDGFGEPLLEKEINGDKEAYYCYTHFNPSWNELVWDASFPQMIYQLIGASSEKTIGNNDKRAINDVQLQLSVISENKKNVLVNTVDTTAGMHVVWLISFLVFCMERYFSLRIKKEKVNA